MSKDVFEQKKRVTMNKPLHVNLKTTGINPITPRTQIDIIPIPEEYYFDNSILNNDSGSKEKTLANTREYIEAANKMLNLARSELGNIDGTKYSNIEGLDWCAYFTVWCLKNTFIDDYFTAFDVIQKEGNIQSDAAAGGTMSVFEFHSNLEFHKSGYYGGEYVPKRGDIIYFDRDAEWDGIIEDNDMYHKTSHVGIVDYVEPDGTIHTIEGNVSNQVVTREYNPSDLQKTSPINPKRIDDYRQIMGFGSWYDIPDFSSTIGEKNITELY